MNKVAQLFHGGPRSKNRRRSNIVISILVVINLLAIMVMSMKTDPSLHHQMYLLNMVITIIFAAEYIIRVATNPKRHYVRYMLGFFSIVDFISIFPVLLSYFFSWNVTLLMVLRLFRVSKFFENIRSMKLVARVVKKIYPVLLLSFLLMGILTFIAGTLLWLVEHHAQPHKFADIPHALWWAVITITGVGYGDVYPITTAGKIIASFIAVLGIFTLAIPTGIISAGFISELRSFKEKKK